MTRRDSLLEARAEVQRARDALAVAPGSVEQAGWRDVEATALSLPPSARAGFLSHHPFDVARTEVLLAFGPDELLGLPPPLARPLACASFLQFLALAGWDETLAEWRRLTRAFEAAAYLRNKGDAQRFAARLPAVLARLHAPAIPDGWLEVPGLPRVHCSLKDSVEAARPLARAHRGEAPWVLGFGHPYCLWLAARDAYETAYARSPSDGKWNVDLPALGDAVNVALSLVPAFERGAAKLGKILLTRAVVGGAGVVLYCPGPDESVRAILESAAGQPAYFVYDSDCGEGASLRRIARLVGKSTGLGRGRAIAAALPRPDLAEQIAADFGAAIELSDVQRRMLRVALTLGVTPAPTDCWTRLVLTYLDGLEGEIAAIPAALGDTALVARIADEARALQRLERDRLKLAPRSLG